MCISIVCRGCQVSTTAHLPYEYLRLFNVCVGCETHVVQDIGEIVNDAIEQRKNGCHRQANYIFFHVFDPIAFGRRQTDER